MGIDIRENTSTDFYNKKLNQIRPGTSRYTGVRDEALISMNNTATTSTNTTSSKATIAENECSDGNDDGKISFWSKVGNAIEGVGKGLVNCVVGAFTTKDAEGNTKFSLGKTLLTAATVAACFIPVVGPAIGCGLAAVGVVSGTTAIVKAGIQAHNIEKNGGTDAEAKAAWENIGSGTLTVAASVVGLKGSAGVLKGQLAGGSTTVAAVKALGKNATTREVVSTAVSKGIQETASNIGQAATMAVTKATNVIEKFKGYKKTYQTGGTNAVRAEIGDDVATLANKAGKWAGDKADEIATTAKSKFTKQGRVTARAEQYLKQYRNGSRIQVDSKNHTSTSGAVWNKKSGVYELFDGDTITTFDKNGLIIRKTTNSNGITTEVSYKNGIEHTTTTTSRLSDGTTQTKTQKGDTTSTTVKDADGTIIQQKNTTEKNGVLNETSQTNNSNYSRKGQTTTDRGYNANTGNGWETTKIKTPEGTSTVTTYTYNGKKYEYIDGVYNGIGEGLSKAQIATIKLEAGKTGNLYQNTNNIIDWEFKGLGNYTNPFGMGIGVYTNLKDDIQ